MLPNLPPVFPHPKPWIVNIESACVLGRSHSSLLIEASDKPETATTEKNHYRICWGVSNNILRRKDAFCVLFGGTFPYLIILFKVCSEKWSNRPWQIFNSLIDVWKCTPENIAIRSKVSPPLLPNHSKHEELTEPSYYLLQLSSRCELHSLIL